MSTEKSFDWHLGAIVEGLALPHGGRPFLIGLLPWSKNTLIRRIKGDSSFTVSELEIVAQALNTTPYEIVAQALRNYGGGEEAGVQKLIAAEGARLVSDPPISIGEHRRKRPSEMTEEELDAFEGQSAANTDPEIGHDEPELP